MGGELFEEEGVLFAPKNSCKPETSSKYDNEGVYFRTEDKEAEDGEQLSISNDRQHGRDSSLA